MPPLSPRRPPAGDGARRQRGVRLVRVHHEQEQGGAWPDQLVLLQQGQPRQPVSACTPLPGAFTSIPAGCRGAVSRLGCLGDRPSRAQAGLWDHNSTHGVPGYFITAEEQCK